MRTGHTSAGRYEIRVQGRLDTRWQAWFDGLTVTPRPDGTTLIAGTVVDQAALHGLLQSLRDLGLPLLSLTQSQDEPAREPPTTSDRTAQPHGRPLRTHDQEESR